MRSLPHNREAEAAVLAGILLRNEALDDVADLLVESSFYVPAYRVVWKAMLRLSEHGEVIDPVTLEHQLKVSNELGMVGGLEGLGKLGDRFASIHHVVRHAEIVARTARQRRMVEMCRLVAEEGMDVLEDVDAWLDDAQRRLMETSAVTKERGYRHVNQFISMEYKALVDQARAAKDAKARQEAPPLLGLRTGIFRLDAMTCGLQPGDLIILAARPSMGKTALGLNLATGVAAHDEPVLIFSMEMTAGQNVGRMMSSEGRVDISRFRAGSTLSDDMEKLHEGCMAVFRMPIAIDERPALPIATMRAEARRWKKDPTYFPNDGKRRHGMVVVDYLQLGKGLGSRERRDLEVSEISSGLKAIAKELDLPVLALSQLNRGVDARPNKRPLLSDLRESGAIEQDADVIMFIYREAVYLADDNPEKHAKARDAELILAKQRNGQIGTVHLVWMGEHQRFENPDYHRGQ